MLSTRSLLPIALLAGALQAQDPSVLDAPKAVLDPLNLDAGTVQRLQLPPTSERPFQVSVVLGDRTRTLSLRPHEIYAPGAALVSITETGQIVRSPLPPSNTFRGVVEGVDGSAVGATLYQGQLTALILLPDTGWSIDPATDAIPTLPRTAHVVYRHDQIRNLDNFCQTVLAPTQPGQPQPRAQQGTGTAPRLLKTLDYMPEITVSYRNQLGLNNAINRINQVSISMDIIYFRNTVFRGVRTTEILNLGVNLTGSAGTMLGRYRNIWRGRPFTRLADVAQAFVAGISGTTIGIAYISGACNTSRVSVVQNFGNSTQRGALSVHEVGHNLSAGHCSGGGCHIMCPSLGGCGRNLTLLGTTSRNRINGFVNARSCFNN